MSRRIQYPGILLDSMYSSVLLGVAEEDFLSPSVQDFFKEAKYSGIFSPMEGRWWKSKLIEIANSIIDPEVRGVNGGAKSAQS